jgi:hypothetical protein
LKKKIKVKVKVKVQKSMVQILNYLLNIVKKKKNTKTVTFNLRVNSIPIELIDIILRQTGNYNFILKFYRYLSYASIKYLLNTSSYKYESYNSEKNNLKFLKITKKIGIYPLSSGINIYFIHNQDEVIKYIISNFPDKVKELEIFDIASSYGNINIMKYLYGNKYTPSESTMNSAIVNNELNSIKYLQSIGENVTKDSAKIACWEGYIEIVKYLYSENDNEEHVNESIEMANYQNHTDVVSFLEKTQ